MKGIHWILALTLVGGLGLSASATAAQNRQQRTPLSQQERQELERRVRQQFDHRLREGLGLNQEEQQQFQRLIQDYRDRRLELSLERRQLQVRLRREGRRQDLTDDEARVMLQASLELADREATLLREEQAALLEILSPAQLVQLYQWREALTQRLRRLQGRGDPGSGTGLFDPGGGLGLGPIV